MSDDTDSRTRELHKAADAAKTDPSLGNGVTVPRGDEGRPGGKRNPFADRQAMFAKSDAMRAAGIPRSGSDVFDPNATGGAPAPATPAPGRETLHLPQRAEDVGATPPSQTQNTYVTLDVEGGQIQVTQADVDRAGGKELYLRRREMDAEAIALRTERTELERQRAADLAESNRLREELRAQRTGQDGPANSIADPATQNRNGSGTTGETDEQRAKRLAKLVYSGDEGDAERALLEVIQNSRAQGSTLSTDELVERVAAKLRTPPTATAPAAPAPVSPMIAATNEAINRMAKSDYADVCNNEVARQATFAKFQEMCRMPGNKDRLAVDIARDACEWGRSTIINPRQGIVEQKRGLPPATAASGATNGATDETEALSNSEYIAALAQRRNFGRRVPS